MQRHVEGVGVVGAESHGEILEGRHLERRTIASSDAGDRSSGRDETRDAVVRCAHAASLLARVCDANDGRASSSEVAPRGAVTSLPRDQTVGFPVCAGNVWCCQLATPRKKKSRFARNV